MYYYESIVINTSTLHGVTNDIQWNRNIY